MLNIKPDVSIFCCRHHFQQQHWKMMGCRVRLHFESLSHLMTKRWTELEWSDLWRGCKWICLECSTLRTTCSFYFWCWLFENQWRALCVQCMSVDGLWWFIFMSNRCIHPHSLWAFSFQGFLFLNYWLHGYQMPKGVLHSWVTKLELVLDAG